MYTGTENQIQIRTVLIKKIYIFSAVNFFPNFWSSNSWIHIRIIDQKCWIWILIRIETNANPQHCFTPYLVGVQVKPASVPRAEGVLSSLKEIALYPTRLPPLPSLRHQDCLLLRQRVVDPDPDPHGSTLIWGGQKWPTNIYKKIKNFHVFIRLGLWFRIRIRKDPH